MLELEAKQTALLTIPVSSLSTGNPKNITDISTASAA